jgi:hypothetical protein
MKNKLKKNLLEKKLLNFLLKEKSCIGKPINVTDPTQYPFLLGQRSKLYTILNPTILIRNLKTFFSFLEFMVKSKESVCFIVNIEDSLLFSKMKKACFMNNHFYFDQSVKLNNLFYSKKPKVIISLFLDTTRQNVLYTESRALNVPVICFTTQISNFFSSNLQILGSFRTKFSQNLLISLIILSLKSK